MPCFAKPRPLHAGECLGTAWFSGQAEDLDSLIADSLSGVQAALDGDRKVPWSGGMGFCHAQGPAERIKVDTNLWANYNDLSRRLVTPNGGGLVRESSPKSPDHSGLGIILICPEIFFVKFRSVFLHCLGLVI